MITSIVFEFRCMQPACADRDKVKPIERLRIPGAQPTSERHNGFIEQPGAIICAECGFDLFLARRVRHMADGSRVDG